MLQLTDAYGVTSHSVINTITKCDYTRANLSMSLSPAFTTCRFKGESSPRRRTRHVGNQHVNLSVRLRNVDSHQAAKMFIDQSSRLAAQT